MRQTRCGKSGEGFTLVMTLSILAAVTILVMGLFSLVSRERQTASGFDAVEQAELAVQAGLERAGAVLKEALADETSVIMAVPVQPWITEMDVVQDTSRSLRSEQGRAERSILMTGRYGEDGLWSYLPVVSGATGSEALGTGLSADPNLTGLKSGRLAMPLAGTYQPAAQRALDGENEVRDLKRAAQRMGDIEPWLRTAPCYWVEFGLPAAGQEEIAGVTGRFCFYVDDLQGKLSLGTTGDVQADAIPAIPVRETPSFKLTAAGRVQEPLHVVPGINVNEPTKPFLNQTSLFALFQRGRDPYGPAAQLDVNRLNIHRRLIELRAMQISPRSWRETLLQPDPVYGWPGLANPAVVSNRFAAEASNLPVGASAGSLIDPSMRAIEENTTHVLPAYEELAMIPPDPAFLWFPGVRKMNLNFWLEQIETLQGTARQTKATEAISAIAEQIATYLPNFAPERMGGYSLPRGNASQTARANAYLRCLAAGMIDYADTDSEPSMDGNPFVDPSGSGAKDYPSYRGMDSYPVVTEQWQRYRLESSAAGAVTYSVTHYIEVWNMTNQPISGEVAAAFEINGRVQVGFGGEIDLAQAALNAEAGKPAVGQLPWNKGSFLPGAWHDPIRMDNPNAPETPNMLVAGPPPSQRPLEPNEVRVLAFTPVRLRIPTGVGTVTSIDFKGRDLSDSDMRSRYRLAFRPAGADKFVLVDQPLAPVERYTRNVSTSTRQRFNTTHPGMSYAMRNSNYANNVGDPRASFFINYFQDVVNYDGGSSPWARNLRRNIGGDPMYRENRTMLWPDGGHNAAARTQSLGSLNRNPDDPSMRPPIHAALNANTANGLMERQKYVQVISNQGRFFSVTELGHVFDPMMWDPNGGSEFDTPQMRDFANIVPGTRARASDKFCGGNTLRIGRPEHTRFQANATAMAPAGAPVDRRRSATALLDLFHCGIPRSMDSLKRSGDFVRIDGHVNLNTASFDVLRALVAGHLATDPRLKLDQSKPEPPLNALNRVQAPSSQPLSDDVDSHPGLADLVAELIIRHRPYLSPAELPEKLRLPTSEELATRPYSRVKEVDINQDGLVLEPGQPILGASRRGSNDRSIEPEWNDAAAEETFARLFNNTTVRSRHFQVVVTGQAIARTRSAQTKVLATRARLYHIFLRPIRDANGNIIRQQTEILYARNL